jgi:hypothetical protein
MEHEGKGKEGMGYGKGKEWSSADFSQHFKDIKFPVKKRDLVNHAKTKGFDQGFMDWLNRLDDTKEFHSVDDLVKFYGKKAA